MSAKLIFYSALSIIGIVFTIAALGAAQQMLQQLMQNKFGTDIINKTTAITNTFCTKASDCKQDSNECTRCVNIMQGGFTLLSKCDSNKIPCDCIDNRCIILN